MQIFIHKENIGRFRKLIAIAQGDPNRDQERYQVLLRLLADEEAKLREASNATRWSSPYNDPIRT